GVALVGGADRGDRAGRGGDCGAATGDDAPPDFLRIVLDPARPRVILLEPELRGVPHPAGVVEQQRARASRSLVDRQDAGRAGHGMDGSRSSITTSYNMLPGPVEVGMSLSFDIIA